MPTIEIVSIQSKNLSLNQADFDVAIIEENKLISHRGLFYDILRKQKGVIIHIGNPNFKDDKKGFFFAGTIIDWDFEPIEIQIPVFDETDQKENSGANQQFKFKFLENYKSDIDKLLIVSLEKSPLKKVYFLTDYQFGPEDGSIVIISTINDLWTRHDKEGLRFNTMYQINGS